MATWKRESKLPWREAGPPNHHDDKVDSDQQVVNKELSLLTVIGPQRIDPRLRQIARTQLICPPTASLSLFHTHTLSLES